MGTLRGEQINLSVLSRIPLERCFWNSISYTFHELTTNYIRLVAIDQ